MSDQFSRTRLMLGDEAVKKLAASRVAVFGVGGVGGYAAEALARAGIGEIDLIDNDTVSESNINRQIYALNSTVGMYKVDVAEKRIKDINPASKVNTYKMFFLPENSGTIVFKAFDYVIDAIDTVAGKLEIIEKAHEAGIPVISAMGAGNKLDPSAFEVADIYDTSVCPLAKVIRQEIRKRGIDSLKVVYSKEPPVMPPERGRTPGSVSFVPPVVGMILAGEVIKDLIK